MNPISVHVATPEETDVLASKIGAHLRGGEVIQLISDLGGGKTSFTRGLAAGAGSEDVVSSPTFTISKVYETGSFDIHHFDFYRLPDAGLIAHELEDLLGDPSVVVVVEWADVVSHILPESTVTIAIEKTGETSRSMSITAPEHLSYLLEGIV